MSAELDTAVAALNRRFLLDFPRLAATRLEELSTDEAVEALQTQDPHVLVPVMSCLAPDVATDILLDLPAELSARILAEMSPNDAAKLMSRLDYEARERHLAMLGEPIAAEIRRLLAYPPDSAGGLMETRVAHFRESATVEATLERLRKDRPRTSRSIFIVNGDNRLVGKVSLQDLALAQPKAILRDLLQPVSAVVHPVAPRDEVVELLEKHMLVDLPVVDVEGRLLGLIYHDALIQAIHEDASVDIQTMVGASAEERALSPALFAVRKRLPWLQVNLLTAFLAAAVVGLFQNTIAQFTALAVLLPVVAGQSGNAGAQALAVTMRGLALREISLRHWLRVTFKEVRAGLVNGIAVAVTCGIGVYFWSGSIGLVLVISMSMVLAMVAAGFAGAVVPIGLTRLGQDPAQSSSIILTTVTDVAGFLSFLGIATLLAGLL
jgi:magnesium transporter